MTPKGRRLCSLRNISLFFSAALGKRLMHDNDSSKPYTSDSVAFPLIFCLFPEKRKDGSLESSQRLSAGWCNLLRIQMRWTRHEETKSRAGDFGRWSSQSHGENLVTRRIVCRMWRICLIYIVAGVRCWLGVLMSLEDWRESVVHGRRISELACCGIGQDTCLVGDPAWCIRLTFSIAVSDVEVR